MGTRSLSGLVFCLSMGLGATATARPTWVCGAPAANRASPRAARLFARVAEASGERSALGALPDGASPCVTPRAVFYPPGDLPADAAEGPPATATATGLFAYLVGLQRHLRVGAVAGEAPAAAARHAGCVLARLGARGDDFTTQLRALLAVVGPAVAGDAWRRAIEEGRRACAR